MKTIRREAESLVVPAPASELQARFLNYLNSLVAFHEGVTAALRAAFSPDAPDQTGRQPDLDSLLADVAKTTDAVQAEHGRLTEEFGISPASGTASPQP